MTSETQRHDRVSTLELFFDLVFVFTITQLTELLLDRPTWAGAGQAVLALWLIWWMYGGYAWLTNAVAPDTVLRKLLLMGGMAGFLVMALAVPEAYDGAGTAFGLGYLLVVLVHGGLFATNGVRAILGLGPYNIFSAALVLLGGALGGPVRYVLWTVALAVQVASPYLSGITGFQVRPAHFVERHGLVVMIALGESVVAVGVGARGLELHPALVAAAVLGLALTAALWWVYFGGDDTRAEAALSALPEERRPLLALHSYGFAHLPVLLGIVAAAAGVKKSIGHAFEVAHADQALLLAGGVALYLAGEAAFRWTLSLRPVVFRLAGAGLALATWFVGHSVSAAWQLLALVVVVVVVLVAEPRT